MKNLQLKKLRLENNKTQKDIAQILNLEVSTLREVFKLNDSEVVSIFLNKNVS